MKFLKVCRISLSEMNTIVISMTCISPDYVCYDILKDIVGKIKDGIVIEADVKYLSGAMDKIERMESYESYGTPFVVSEWCRFLTQCGVNT